MRCSERVGGRGARAVACCAPRSASRSRSSPAAPAHKSSDSYLQLDARPGALAVRWDIALRDLDVALDLDADGDGKLTWGEVRTAWPRIEAYATARLAIEGCALRDRRARPRAAQRRRLCGAAAVARPARCRRRRRSAIRCSPRSTRPIAASPRSQRARRAGGALGARPGAGRRRVRRRASAAAAAGVGRDGRRRPQPARRRRRAGSSSREGIRHILTGYDHVLFLLCLLLPAVMRRRGRRLAAGRAAVAGVLPVAGIVTAFTVAHSITLALAALKLVSLPPAFIEPAIAVTIVLAALDNVWPVFPVRRVVVDLLLRPDPRLRLRQRARRAEPADAPTSPGRCCSSTSASRPGSCIVVVAATAVLFGLRRWPRYRRVVIGGGSFAGDRDRRALVRRAHRGRLDAAVLRPARLTIGAWTTTRARKACRL